MNKDKDYGAGYIGMPSTGAEGGVCAGPHASLTGYRAALEVDRQASVLANATGEGAEKWAVPGRKDEVFMKKPKLKRTPPGMNRSSAPEAPIRRPESVDLTGDEEDEIPQAISVKRVNKRSVKDNNKTDMSSELRGKIKPNLETIMRILQTIMEQNKKIGNYILNNTAVEAGIKEEYLSMGCHLEEVTENIIGFRGTQDKKDEEYNREEKDGNEDKLLTVTGTTPRRNAAETKTLEKENRKEYKTIATQTMNEEESDFPPLPTARYKRKEITPPFEKQGKKTRFFVNMETTPVETQEGMDKQTQKRLGNEQDQEWEEVRMRRRRENKELERIEKGTPREGRGAEGKEKVGVSPNGNNINKGTPRRALKPQAIAIRFSKDKTFADVLKKVKNASGKTPEGIKTVKKTRAGNLLIEFTPGADVEGFRRNLVDKLDEDVEIAKLQAQRNRPLGR